MRVFLTHFHIELVKQELEKKGLFQNIVVHHATAGSVQKKETEISKPLKLSSAYPSISTGSHDLISAPLTGTKTSILDLSIAGGLIANMTQIVFSFNRKPEVYFGRRLSLYRITIATLFSRI